jgi:signal transduction histidine kinase
MKTLKQNCYRLLRLINNLIDITKIDSGFMNINLRNCNIVSTVEDITLSVVDYVENKGINLIFDTEVEEKIMAIDPDKIERIILNLLSNAIKFTDSGANITVTIYDRGDNIIISVKDTGCGMPEDKLHTIFERFAQVDKLTARANKGSGIGLSLVKSLVEMHNGTISVESKVGEGSEFLITLPVNVNPDETDMQDFINTCIQPSHVESINIEFSDIYS